VLLEGKVLLVTGGGNGIGEATALKFHEQGAKVAVVDIDGEAAQAVANDIGSRGGSAIAITADISVEQQVIQMVADTVDAFGRLDGASNNAALGGGFNYIHETEEKNWDKAMSVTLKGTWLCMKHEITTMLAQGSGAIVNIASLSGIRGEALQSPYSSAKGGVVALTKTGAAEYAQKGIRVNAIAPGGIRTRALQMYFDQVPGAREHTEGVHAMRRAGEPEEIADAVCYLLSDQASFITGEVLNVDGGVMVNPHTL